MSQFLLDADSGKRVCAERRRSDANSAQQRQWLHQHAPFLRLLLHAAGERPPPNAHTSSSSRAAVPARALRSRSRLLIATSAASQMLTQVVSAERSSHMQPGYTSPVARHRGILAFAGGLPPRLHSVVAAVSLLQPGVRALLCQQQRQRVH